MAFNKGARILIRELRRGLPQHCLFECYQQDFLMYERVLNQQPKDKNKIYSLHEPQVYCMAKGKDHKPYEYGSRASIASTATSNIIVGVVSRMRRICMTVTPYPKYLRMLKRHVARRLNKPYVTGAIVEKAASMKPRSYCLKKH